MKTVVYLDLDGTVLGKDPSGDNIPVDLCKSRGAQLLVDYYGKCYLTPHNKSILQQLRKIGVEIVAVTARYIESALSFDDDFIQLFDRIYSDKGLHCYNVKEDLMLSECSRYFKDHLDRIAESEEKLLPLLKEFNLDDSNFISKDKQVVCWELDLGSHVDLEPQAEAIVRRIKRLGLSAEYKEKFHIIEIEMCPLTKADAICFDKAYFRNQDYTICMGDSKCDLEMLRECDYGIFPHHLLDNEALEKELVQQKKISVLDEVSWRHDNLTIAYLKVMLQRVHNVKNSNEGELCV